MNNSPIESLKQGFLIPLENNLKRIKALSLGHFKSQSDIDKQYGVIMGLEDCLGHFNAVYESIMNQTNGAAPMQQPDVTTVEPDEIIQPSEA